MKFSVMAPGVLPCAQNPKTMTTSSTWESLLLLNHGNTITNEKAKTFDSIHRHPTSTYCDLVQELGVIVTMQKYARVDKSFMKQFYWNYGFNLCYEI